MDKFTKTTEIDTSDLNLLEETPKKSKVGKVVALIISLLLAVAIWLYVVETDTTVVDKEYTGIKVEIVNEELNGYEITADDISVTVSGTTSQLVDIDESDITVKVRITTDDLVEGERRVKPIEVSVDGIESDAIKNRDSIEVTIHVKKHVG